MQDYYQSHRQLGFIGDAGQQKISAAKVLVIGAGGLGCPCLLQLAACGAGTIGVADFDVVSLSNLHRQTLYTLADVGKGKVKTAIAALSAHNPDVDLISHDFLVDQTNVLDLVRGYDIIVDGTDNFLVRYLINDACVVTGKPVVYGAIYQTEGQLTVFSYQNSPTLRCLFPEPPPENAIQSCAEIGAYSITTAMIGNMMAGEVVKLILDDDAVFTGKLLCVDVVLGKIRQLGYHENPQSRAISLARFKQKEQPVAVAAKDFKQQFAGKNYQLVDVRKDDERENNIGGINIPLAKIMRSLPEGFSADDQLIFYCQQGLRSHQAAEIFRKAGYPNAFSLQGGLSAYKNHLFLFEDFSAAK